MSRYFKEDRNGWLCEIFVVEADFWVSWIARKKNKCVLETAGVDRSLFATVKQIKLSYFGHILRRLGDCLEKEAIQDTIPGSHTHIPKVVLINNNTS